MNQNIHARDTYGNGNFNNGIFINITQSFNLERSSDWQKFLAQEQELVQECEKLEERVKKYLDDDEFHRDLQEKRQKLHTLRQEMENFKRDVIKLVEDFQRIPLDTERLRQAYAHFQKGDFREARAVLNTEAMQHDQDRLLARKQALAQQTAENAEQLKHNAQEWLLKARLTALDYSLKEQRIPQTCAAFKTALKSDNSADNLFMYAYFLQQNNQYGEAEDYYHQALTAYEQQKDDIFHKNNQYNIATTLNNLAALISGDDDTKRRKDAETLATKALDIRRELVRNNHNVSESEKDEFAQNLTSTMNNLALLMVKDPKRHEYAEKLLNEALDIHFERTKNPLCQFDSDFAARLDSDIANTLNSLAMLIKQDRKRLGEAEINYQDALEIYRELVQYYCGFENNIATTLNNLANLILDDPKRSMEAKKLYQEALIYHRIQAKYNLTVAQPGLARTLFHLGNVYMKQQQPARAKRLLRKAATLVAPYATEYPKRFGGLQQDIQNLLSQIP